MKNGLYICVANMINNLAYIVEANGEQDQPANVEQPSDNLVFDTNV